ncbi:MAG: tetratricopeptide repeat protein [Deltaproteobacteria bacterium]|nr:tetratricopeptide repeat protein [Deltaproteobacteria bacterium]
MPSMYFCAHCNKEFVPDTPDAKPRCPQCMRRGGVEPAQEVVARGRQRRPWILVVALLIVGVGIGYGLYLATRVALEEAPPLRPLTTKELAAYLERDQIQVGPYESLMMLSGEVEGWPEGAGEISAKMEAVSSHWSLERPLPRELFGADQTLATIDAAEGRLSLYPLEMATAMTALLRARGVNAMVAEVWELEGTGAPADPSGMLGYFVVALYESAAAAEPSALLDPWGGGEAEPASVRVLRDTEVLAAALGTEAARLFARSGDGAKSLPMIETALLLDPVSPSLRGVNATILLESGGVDQAVKEFEAAAQLRPDGPRQLNTVQLHLAQASILEMNGQQDAAKAEFDRGSRIVGEVIERWPRYARAHVLLASVYLGNDELERARLELEAAEALSPDAPLLWSIWAQYHLSVNDPTTAAANMKRAVSLDPDNWQLRLQAARVLQGADDDEGAKANLSAAMQMVAPEKRADVRKFIERMMGPGALDDAPPPAAAEAPADPALMLGDPTKLRLRDPGESLKLELDE